MASAKEINNKIRSIQNTRKITKAMEMVAASKMRKAQQRMLASRPYLTRVKEVIGHLVKGNLEYTHPFMLERPVKRVGVLVISSDRGLCGGLNTNLFKVLLSKMHDWHKAGVEVDLCTVGRKGEVFFTHHNAKVIASITYVGDSPKVKDLIGIIKVLMDAFLNQEIDEIYIVYNKFISTISQQPQMERLLPIADPQHDMHNRSWDYIYEPAPEMLLDMLLHRYIETLVYQGAVENVASEQAARMVAMKNATDNAGELIDDFKLMYNKARQAAITKELAEIVAGAAAV